MRKGKAELIAVDDMLRLSMTDRAWREHQDRRAAVISCLRRNLWWFRFVNKPKQVRIADNIIGAANTGI